MGIGNDDFVLERDGNKKLTRAIEDIKVAMATGVDGKIILGMAKALKVRATTFATTGENEYLRRLADNAYKVANKVIEFYK